MISTSWSLNVLLEPGRKSDRTVRWFPNGYPRRNSMDKLDRRSALAFFGLFAASAAGVKPAASQAMDMTAGKDTTLAPGVVQRVYGEGPAIIPGFKRVSMRDIIMQPGSKTADNAMPNAMVCHITEAELRLVQDGSNTFTAKKNHV